MEGNNISEKFFSFKKVHPCTIKLFFINGMFFLIITFKLKCNQII